MSNILEHDLRTYGFADVVAVTNVNKDTVQNWLRNGWPRLQEQSPGKGGRRAFHLIDLYSFRLMAVGVRHGLPPSIMAEALGNLIWRPLDMMEESPAPNGCKPIPTPSEWIASIYEWITDRKAANWLIVHNSVTLGPLARVLPAETPLADLASFVQRPADDPAPRAFTVINATAEFNHVDQVLSALYGAEPVTLDNVFEEAAKAFGDEDA